MKFAWTGRCFSGTMPSLRAWPTSRCRLGVGGRRLVTLYDCQSIGQTLSVPGDLRERLDAARALIGAHVPNLKVVAARLALEHLTAWAGVAPMKVERMRLEERDGVDS